jgi:hypothetical protein
MPFIEDWRQKLMKLCLGCSFVGEPKKYRPGTTRREVGLWLLFLIPGILYFMGSMSARLPGVLYSIWRQLAPYRPTTFPMQVGLWLTFLVPGILYSFGRRWASYEGCATCGSKQIVPVESPLANAALGRFSPTPSGQAWVCDKCGKPIFGGGRFCESCAPRR